MSELETLFKNLRKLHEDIWKSIEESIEETRRYFEESFREFEDLMRKSFEEIDRRVREKGIFGLLSEELISFSYEKIGNEKPRLEIRGIRRYKRLGED